MCQLSSKFTKARGFVAPKWQRELPRARTAGVRVGDGQRVATSSQVLLVVPAPARHPLPEKLLGLARLGPFWLFGRSGLCGSVRRGLNDKTTPSRVPHRSW